MKIFFNIIICLMFGVASASDKAITSADEAVAKALEYTGFDKSKTYITKRAEDIAILTKIIDSTTPSICDTINSKNVWVVSFTRIQLQPFKEVEPNDLYPKDYEVILDPETGNLLKINSSFFEFESDRQNDPPAEMKEKEPGGMQSFYGFPNEIPKLSFYDVVKVQHSNSTIGVKHISAIYIKQFHPVHGEKGYWCVTHRGIVGPETRIIIKKQIIDSESGKVVAIKGKKKGHAFGH